MADGQMHMGELLDLLIIETRTFWTHVYFHLKFELLVLFGHVF